MARPAECRTNVTTNTATADQVKTGTGFIYWIAVSSNSGTLYQTVLYDNTSDATPVFTAEAASTGAVALVFDPPITCATGIRVKQENAALTTSIGYD